MITKLNVATIYVLDKDEALDFYVNKLGLEVGSDFTQGDYRWLTVRVPGQDGTEISLEQPGAPLHDEATAEQLRELISKGAMSGLVFNTDDARGLLDVLGLTPLSTASPYHLSGGEQRRLMIAAALAHGPFSALLDEPTVGQDRETWAAVVGVAKAARDAGAGIVLSTHDAAAVAAAADQVVTLEAGRVVAR